MTANTASPTRCVTLPTEGTAASTASVSPTTSFVARQAIKDGGAGCKMADVERLVREARWSHDFADYVPA